jgi:teichuronic acid biosynthesis glycosyltransferase TuaC
VTFEIRDRCPEVLVVTNAWPHSEDLAYGIFIQRQIRSLQELGIRFDVMFVRGYRSQAAYGVAAALLARLSRIGHPTYQLVHGHGGETGPSVAAYRRAPRLLSYLGDDVLGTPRADGFVPFSSKIRRGVLRRTALLMSRTITKSYEMQCALPRPCRGKNDVIPNGVDETVFAPCPRDEARRILGWNPGARIVLFGGNPKIPRKRYWLAEAATARASDALTGLELKILESVDPRTVPLMMNAADCLLLPSAIEGSPNVVKEALMCNLPVIATPAGDLEELLHGVSPSWICETSPEPIAAALVECLSVPRRSNGRSRSRHLTATAIAARVRSAYSRATMREAWGDHVEFAS